MKKLLFSLIFFVFLFSSCSDTDKKPLVISTNTWVGYSPLFYAREMGWLKEINIELMSVVSLRESMHLYSAGVSDVFTGTQHEFQKQREEFPALIPVILFDKSNGGDAIMSNIRLDALKNSDEKIEVFLELDSINEEMLNSFIATHAISKKRLIIHNRIQDEIALMKNTAISPMTLIVTYDPYINALKKNGFQEVANTKNDQGLFVVDALYVSSELFYENHEQFIKLNKIIQRSIGVLHSNPKEYYEKVKLYLDTPTYDEFLKMTTNIEWIHENPSKEVLNQMVKIEFPQKDIVQ